jgi:predicted ATPase/DNA-binding XRE family transcriptional regulator
MGGESFAQLLKRHRIAAGLSQEALAERAGVSVDAISALERGARHAPYKATLDLLIGALTHDDDTRREIEEAATLARARGPQSQRQGLFPNLPPQLTSFVDRVEVVAEIKELLGSHRLVTLIGTGGAGKTRSAIKVAAEIFDSYDDGVWLAELAPISIPSLVASVIARTLHVQEAPNRPMLDTLLAYLKRKRLLLVVDNCEHVIEEARRVVAAILHGCPDVHILATSRESLTIAGEQAYRMPSLSVPSKSELLSTEEMSQYAAVQLFIDRAVSAENGFTLSGESAPHVAEICRRLDGMPLAIELAAARINVLSPHELAQKLDERFRLLTAGDRSALPRHRTMRALIDWSYDLLSDDERRLFRKLSIFAGDFTLELAGAVCSDNDMDEIAVIDLLSSLIDKSLVQAEQLLSERRYRLLESTRQYARERLAETGEYDTVARAHATTFLMLAEELNRTYETTPERVWFAQAEREMQNFRAALSWALGTRRDVLLGQRLAGALSPAWLRFATVEGRHWVQDALDLTGAETPAPVIAALDLTEAQLSGALTQHKASRVAAERALARYRQLEDPLKLAWAECVLATALCSLFLGSLEDGEALLQRVLVKGRALGAHRLVGRALQELALARTALGDVTTARQFYAEALASYHAIAAENSAANVAANLAELEFRCGDAAKAVRVVSEAHVAYRAFNSTRNVAMALCNESAYLTALARYDEARLAGRAALGAARDAQYEVGLTYVLQHLAAVGALRPSDKTENRHDDQFRAARLLGNVDARVAALDAVREYTEQQEVDKMITALRDAIGEEQLAKLMTEGSRWSEDQAVAEAMLI